MCVVVEMQVCSPDGHAAAPAPALCSGPIAAMVLLHTMKGPSTVSLLPADKTTRMFLPLRNITNSD